MYVHLCIRFGAPDMDMHHPKKQAVILAYGQTGSGKTFTMEGQGEPLIDDAAPSAASEGEGDAMEEEDEEEEGAGTVPPGPCSSNRNKSGGAAAAVPTLPSGAGVNPRALAELFRLKAEREGQGMADVEVR